MSFQSRKLSQKSLFASRASTKWPPWPNFNGSYLENDMEYDLAFLYVFIWATSNHSDEKLVDLTQMTHRKEGLSLGKFAIPPFLLPRVHIYDKFSVYALYHKLAMLSSSASHKLRVSLAWKFSTGHQPFQLLLRGKLKDPLY